MVVKYLNWVLTVSCAVFLMVGTYSGKLTKICVMIAIGAFVLLRLYDKRGLFFKNFFENTSLNKAIYCFLSVAVLATIFGISPYESQKVLFSRYVIYFLVFFTGAFLGRKKSNINILLLALLSGAVIVSIGSIADMIRTGHLQRMYTSFGLGIYGTYSLYILPFFIGFIIFHPSLKIRLFCVMVSVPAFIAFILQGYRGVWVGFLSAIITVIVLFGIKKRYLIGVLLIFLALLCLMPVFRERVFWDEDANNINVININARFHMWEAAANIFKKYPVLGAGPGSYGVLMYDFYPGEIEGGRIHIHAHNTYMEVLADMGIAGLLSFLWIFVLFFLSGYKSIKSKMDFYKVSFMIMFIAVAVSEFFMSVVLVGITTPVVFWFLLGVGTQVYKEKESRPV